MLPRFALASLLLTLGVWGCNGGGEDGSLTHDPAIPTAGGLSETAEADVPKGDSFYAVLDTSKGNVIVEVNPGWAPEGAARFKELAESGFYDACKFFRVLPGFMAQVGMNGNPSVNAKWQDDTIPDDPVLVSNTRGRVTFAKKPLPNSRTTQVFFNYGDNSRLDHDGFAPFGEIVEGIEVLESLYGGYGEGAPRGSGPNQEEIGLRGNDYLNQSYPKLDYIDTVQLFDTEEAARAALSDSGETPAADDTDGSAPEAESADQPAAETPAEETAE